MKKITYLLAAGGIAGVLGYFVGCFFSCGDSASSWGAATAFSFIAGIIGLIVGWIADSEEKAIKEEKERERRAEEQRQARELKYRREQQLKQEEEQRFQDWYDKIKLVYRKIEKNVGVDFDHKPFYTQIHNEYNPDELSDRQKNAYVLMKKEHIIKLKSELKQCLLREMGIGGLAQSTSIINCLTIVEPDVEENKIAERILREMLTITMKPLYYISFSGYGDCNLQSILENDNEKMLNTAESLMEKHHDIETCLRESDQNIVSIIVKFLYPEIIKEQCSVMWYYANKKPFDVTKFENARFTFMLHTAMYYKDANLPENLKAFSYGGDNFKVVALGKVEEVLARIYSKNLIGGKVTVNQEKNYINYWLERRIESEGYDDCYVLASGLAWLELYDLELDVLRKLVSSDVQLPTELQERLSFLESGGNTNIKLYEINDLSVFYFDNSSADWKATDFAVLFRKMAMKKMCINYSMLISKWTKTLPLSSGQKISNNHINQMLSNLVQDFDNEITYQVVKASAVNMANVQYDNAVLFQFTTERNRCVSILFSYEKFGRNLNLTILTLFTPEQKFTIDQLEKYCIAIKDNVYVESFRESILQVVDEAIKVKQSIYDEEAIIGRKIVDFSGND